MTLAEVKDMISEERTMYVPEQYRRVRRLHSKRYMIWKCLASFRMWQYWKEQYARADLGRFRWRFAKIACQYHLRAMNLYGEKAGVEFSQRCVLGRRLNIWHGGVVISGNLGDDCVIHGNNIIGNKGDRDGRTPVIGNRVDVGAGAVVIGGIEIADGCTIGANAVVNKSFTEAGSLIVGIPACLKGK